VQFYYSKGQIGHTVIHTENAAFIGRGEERLAAEYAGNFLKKRRIWECDRLKKIFCGGKGLRQAPR